MFGRCGSEAGSILTTGPITDRQIRTKVGDICHEVDVHSFVDDAEEADPGAGDGGLVRRVPPADRAFEKCWKSIEDGKPCTLRCRLRLAS